MPLSQGGVIMLVSQKAALWNDRSALLYNIQHKVWRMSNKRTTGQKEENGKGALLWHFSFRAQSHWKTSEWTCKHALRETWTPKVWQKSFEYNIKGARRETAEKKLVWTRLIKKKQPGGRMTQRNWNIVIFHEPAARTVIFSFSSVVCILDEMCLTTASSCCDLWPSRKARRSYVTAQQSPAPCHFVSQPRWGTRQNHSTHQQLSAPTKPPDFTLRLFFRSRLSSK